MHHKLNELAAMMLDLAAEEFSNAGCNDFEFPSNWTEAEKTAFIKDYCKWNGDYEDDIVNPLREANRQANEHLSILTNRYASIPDFAIMNFLAHLLREDPGRTFGPFDGTDDLINYLHESLNKD